MRRAMRPSPRAVSKVFRPATTAPARAPGSPISSDTMPVMGASSSIRPRHSRDPLSSPAGLRSMFFSIRCWRLSAARSSRRDPRIIDQKRRYQRSWRRLSPSPTIALKPRCRGWATSLKALTAGSASSVPAPISCTTPVRRSPSPSMERDSRPDSSSPADGSPLPATKRPSGPRPLPAPGAESDRSRPGDAVAPRAAKRPLASRSRCGVTAATDGAGRRASALCAGASEGDASRGESAPVVVAEVVASVSALR